MDRKTLYWLPYWLAQLTSTCCLLAIVQTEYSSTLLSKMYLLYLNNCIAFYEIQLFFCVFDSYCWMPKYSIYEHFVGMWYFWHWVLHCLFWRQTFNSPFFTNLYSVVYMLLPSGFDLLVACPYFITALTPQSHSNLYTSVYYPWYGQSHD